MAKRVSGEVIVDVTYQRKVKVGERLVPKGAFRAKIISDGEVVDAMTITVPKSLEKSETSAKAIDAIAKTAIHFTLSDNPSLLVERDERGSILLGKG